MGDRVLFVVTNGNEISPAIHGHWVGSDAEKIIEAAAPKMRGMDVGYAALALAAEVHKAASSPGRPYASAGMFAGPDDLEPATL